MANTFKMEEVDNLARIGSALVSKDMVLAATIRRDFSAEFAGKRGASVNVRIPATVTASSRALDTATALTLSQITEGTQPVALTDNEYNAVVLSDEDMSLRIEDYAEQIMAPQALAISEAIETRVTTLIDGLGALTGVTLAADGSDIVSGFIDAREALRNLGAPATGLYAAVPTDVYSMLLKAQVVAGNNGGQGDALANATVGRVAGFTVVESNRLTTGKVAFYHRDAVSLVLRAPAVPTSVGWGSSQQAAGGVPIRITRSWDNDALAERAVVNVYSGRGTLTAKLSGGSAGNNTDGTPKGNAGSNVLFAGSVTLA